MKNNDGREAMTGVSLTTRWPINLIYVAKTSTELLCHIRLGFMEPSFCDVEWYLLRYYLVLVSVLSSWGFPVFAILFLCLPDFL